MPLEVAKFMGGLGLKVYDVYGMTETTGAFTSNGPDHFKLGTVGVPNPGIEVRLGEDGEILCRGPVNTPGYHRQEAATRNLIDEDGWIHTGDIGTVDEDGFYSIIDRKKELIITSAGKNIAPSNIENYLKESPIVGHAMALGDNRSYVVAILTLDGEIAPLVAAKLGVEFTDLADLSAKPEIRAMAQAAVDKANERLSRPEQVKAWELLPDEWTAESEELTPTLKLKRRVVNTKYADVVERLYAAEAGAPFDLQAHRGGAGLWPENTLEAFGRALALGVSTLELDVHLTAEDDVVVAHDPALADARRSVQLTRADLPPTMPLLRQVAALLEERGADPVRINLEIKYDALDAAQLTSREAFVAKVVDALRIDGLVGRTSIQCFDWGVLDRVGEAEPALDRNLLVSPKYLEAAADAPSPWFDGLAVDADFVRTAAAEGFTAISPIHGSPFRSGVTDPAYTPFATAELVDAAHAAGLARHPLRRRRRAHDAPPRPARGGRAHHQPPRPLARRPGRRRTVSCHRPSPGRQPPGVPRSPTDMTTFRAPLLAAAALAALALASPTAARRRGTGRRRRPLGPDHALRRLRPRARARRPRWPGPSAGRAGPSIHGVGGTTTPAPNTLDQFAPMGSGLRRPDRRQPARSTTRWVGADGSPGRREWRTGYGLAVSPAAGRRPSPARPGRSGRSTSRATASSPSTPCRSPARARPSRSSARTARRATASNGCAVYVNGARAWLHLLARHRRPRAPCPADLHRSRALARGHHLGQRHRHVQRDAAQLAGAVAHLRQPVLRHLPGQPPRPRHAGVRRRLRPAAARPPGDRRRLRGAVVRARPRRQLGDVLRRGVGGRRARARRDVPGREVGGRAARRRRVDGVRRRAPQPARPTCARPSSSRRGERHHPV